MDQSTLLNALKYLNYTHDRKGAAFVKKEAARIYSLVETCCVDFTQGLHKYVFSRKGEKRRCVANYESAFSDGYAMQRILAVKLKKLFRVRYPNRALMMHEFFEATKSLEKLHDFTIIRFDFKSYFYSIRLTDAWERFLKISCGKLPSDDCSLVESYCRQIGIAYPGLEMSNVVAEILGAEFDLKIKAFFGDYGIIFYGRFVDDGVLILHKGLPEHVIRSTMNKCLRDTFSPKGWPGTCTTKYHSFNKPGSKYSSANLSQIQNGPFSFDYLGYCFRFDKPVSGNSETCKVSYGISQAKINKFRNLLTKRLERAKTYNEIKLLIKLKCARIVYLAKDFGLMKWHEKGFASTYKELRNIGDDDWIVETTQALNSLVQQSLNDSGVFRLLTPNQIRSIEATLACQPKAAIRKGTSIILSYRKSVGISWKTLMNYVKILGCVAHTTDYHSLTKELLIFAGVGY